MQVDVDLEARTEVPWWLAYGTPVFTILAALVVSGLALLALDVNPLNAYQIMFVQTVSTEFGLTETVAKAVPLIFAGLAVYLPLKANLWKPGRDVRRANPRPPVPAAPTGYRLRQSRLKVAC